jgi:peptide-N4-(N-acetyl-beta-glucosaminyl)asparagine amidase
MRIICPHPAPQVRYAKLGAILTCAPVADVLMRHCRFRPLLLTAEPMSAGAAAAATSQGPPVPVPAGEDVFLVLAADPSGQDVARAAEALAVLRPLARQQ